MDKGLVLGVIQVRMGSSRLPQKALKNINGKPLLWYLHERVRFSKLIDKAVISTVDNQSNLPITQFAENNNIEYFAGSEQDLVDRLYQTAKKFNGEAIVRITGDCPLVDPKLIDKMVNVYLENKGRFDYICNTVKPTYPDGLDIEVIPFKTLEKAWQEIKDPFWREWFTSYIIEHPDSYRLHNVENEKDYSGLRWTVDYEEDFDFVSRIVKKLYKQNKAFAMQDILELLEREPLLNEINKKYSRNVSYYEAKRRANK